MPAGFAVKFRNWQGRQGVDEPDYATVFRMMTLLESLHLAVHKVNLPEALAAATTNCTIPRGTTITLSAQTAARSW